MDGMAADGECWNRARATYCDSWWLGSAGAGKFTGLVCYTLAGQALRNVMKR